MWKDRWKGGRLRDQVVTSTSEKPLSLPLKQNTVTHAMARSEAEKWDKTNMKSKRWWSYKVLLMIIGGILPPLGTYTRSED